jgi:hypothetical protein
MKTSIKVLLLMFAVIASIAGVLMYAKTVVAPPTGIKPVAQYVKALDAESQQLDANSDFSSCHRKYVTLADKIHRFRAEDKITDREADRFRVKVDSIFGSYMVGYGNAVLRKSEWPAEHLKNITENVKALKSDKLTSGEKALSGELQQSLDGINSAVNSYYQALTLSNSHSFRSLEDASSKLAQAKSYKESYPLQNNAALVMALNDLPQHLATAHYNYVNRLVNNLAWYRSYTREYYTNTITAQVDSALSEYEETSIYGNQKPSSQPLRDRITSLIEEAMVYYYYN